MKMNAINLFERTTENIKSRGYQITWLSEQNHWFAIGEHKKKGDRHINVYITYRNNGTFENVTVILEVIETLNEYGCGKIIAKIKIPKNASDRVLNNRIDRAISIMKTGIVV